MRFLRSGTPTNAADQNGTNWSFSNDRTLVNGQVTIDVVDDQGASGFAALTETETITTYVVFFPNAGAQTLTFDYDLLNGRGGQGVRLVIDDQGNSVAEVNTFSSAIVGVDELSNKEGFEPVSVARRAEILAAPCRQPRATCRVCRPRRDNSTQDRCCRAAGA